MRKLSAVIVLAAAILLFVPLNISFALEPVAIHTVMRAHKRRRGSPTSHAMQVQTGEPEMIATGVLRPKAVTIREASRLLADKARSEIYVLVRRGILRAFKDGGRTLIEVASIEKYAAENFQPATRLVEPPALTAVWACSDRKRGHRADTVAASKTAKSRERSLERS
jgi:hypothetical protein